MSFIIPIVLLFSAYHCYYFVNMNSQEQLETFNLIIDDENYSSDLNLAFSFAIWSRYAPLSQIAQVGKFGLFNSNCLHYHNAAGKISKTINFIYFDCLDIENLLITKTVKFFDQSHVEHVFSSIINNDLYEYTWHYFQIMQWPQVNKFRIILVANPMILLEEELQIQYPYFEKNLILTFGGGVNAYYDSTLLQYSYFPGTMMLYPLDQSRMNPAFTLQDLAFSGYVNFNCQCKFNSDINVVKDKLFSVQDILTYSSAYPNCDYFQLVGWLKVSEIVSDGNDFTYKILKMTTDSQNNRLTDDNLSPFTLSYYISSSGNKLIFTTYSYTFPTVDINFSKNPFLITTEIDLNHDLKLWMYFKVILSDDQLDVSIIYYQGENNYPFEKSIQVKQFHIVAFSVHVGNLESKLENYLLFQANQIQFSNCDFLQFVKACHNSCEVCDGPTKFDCLTCQTNSNRKYLPQTKQCVCPYETIDEYYCKTMSQLNFETFIPEDKLIQCSNGYFQVDALCLPCPSVLRNEQITCLECITNPNEWINMLYCKKSLVSNNGLPFQQEQQESLYFTFSGIDLKLCQYCTSSCFDDDCIYSDFDWITLLPFQFCTNSIGIQCVSCKLAQCIVCDLTVFGETCRICNFSSELINGKCIFWYEGDKIGCLNNCAYCYNGVCQSCYPPYYLASDRRECKLCSIEHCQYCFEYLMTDLTLTTLYKDFPSFEFSDLVKVGCSLCQSGFNYDFISEKCVAGKPDILNCLRSFIDQNDNEICVLSAVDDFNIAPQIMNCQNHISNCEQCILTSSQVIKCIICQNGYVASLETGHCEQCLILHSIQCLQGDRYLEDYWVQRFQSFLMQFLPDSYYYPKPTSSYWITTFPLSCQIGYEQNTNNCQKYCDSNCLSCVLDTQHGQFNCQKCAPNYYGISVQSQDGGVCLDCPLLCMLCTIRTNEEIQQINPFFILTNSNIGYTYKCLSPIQDENIILDSGIQVATYCVQDDCANSLKYQLNLTCDNMQQLFMENYYTYYENYIDTNYCNQIGMKTFQLELNYQLNFHQLQCFVNNQTIIQTSLKESVFSLKHTYLLFIGEQNLTNYISYGWTLNNFDSITFQFVKYKAEFLGNLIINNNNLPVDITFNNSFFFGNLDVIYTFQIQAPLYRDLQFNNVSLVSLSLTNVTWLEYKSNLQEKMILITELKIYNCTFQNVVLFNFIKYVKEIQFSTIIILNSTFINSTLLKTNKNTENTGACRIKYIFVEQSALKSSTLIVSKMITISMFNLLDSILDNSVVLQSESNIYLSGVNISNNYFFSSRFFSAKMNTLQVTTFISCFFTEIKVQNTAFSNSSLFSFNQATLDFIKLNIQFINISHFYLKNSDLLDDSQIYLYDLKSQQLQVKNFEIYNSFNLQYFKITQTQIIQIENVHYHNDLQLFKIPASPQCFSTTYYSATLLHISGFSDIKIKNIQIINQFNIDHSFLQILSDLLYQPSQTEIINISQVFIQGNILLKRDLGKFLSLLTIYSDRFQEIQLDSITFVENFFNQLANDPSQTTAGLIYISSLQSNVRINNISCLSNGLTNSSFSLISIHSLNLYLIQCKFENSNILSNKIWSKYYQIDSTLEQNDVMNNQLIQQVMTIYNIQNQGGVFELMAQAIQISSVFFFQILSSGTSIFSITSQGQGRIQITNVTIISASTLLSSTSLMDGCITINSKSSLLNLQISDIYLEEVYNRFGSAIITIYPSSKQNYISLINITILDSFSLMNQILAPDFISDSADFNSITIKNFKASYTEQGWNYYLSQLQFPSAAEIKKIKSENALINLKYCTLIVNDFYLTGVLISPIMILTDLKQIILKNLKVENVLVMFPMRLFQQYQTTISKLDVIMIHVNALNITQIVQSKDKQNQVIAVPQINLNLQECIFNLIISHQLIFNQTLSELTDQLSLETELIGALVYVMGVSSQSKLRLKQIKMIDNNCAFCYDGLIFIQLNLQAIVKIEELNCQFNFISQFGCLFLSTEENLQQSLEKVTIKKSAFIQNSGSQGVGIFSQNVLFAISNTTFLNNIGSNKGGAIFASNLANNFIIIQTLIIQNTAEIGGGIYFAGKNKLTGKNFISSIVLFNNAKILSNNVVEISNHLTLTINNQEMLFNQIVQENKQFLILSLLPYQCIEQGKVITTKTLLLPSSQSFLKYTLFNTKKQYPEPYLTEISLHFKNQMNEILPGGIADICQLQQRSYNNNEPNSNELFTPITEITFNSNSNSFDLGKIAINFNPYSSENQLLQLQFICQSQTSAEPLYYQVNARTFKCQLGEFITKGACQICEPNYGFYSVTYDATACSIFDKTKFVNITSNEIQLKAGFWRPNHFSDLVENCFKSWQWCIGGWGVHNDLCLNGHIGGLCEECDIHNIRGNGHYLKTSDALCAICQNGIETVMPFIFITLWSVISILLTLKSINRTNKTFAVLKVSNKLFEIVFKLSQDFESILLKMFLNYLWLFSVIFTFNITFGFSFRFVDQASNPSYFMASNMDCQFSQFENAELIYVRIIAMIIFMIIQSILISVGFKLQSTITNKPFDFSVISNTVIYLFVSNQAALIKKQYYQIYFSFGSLIAQRQISGIQYIQGDVSLLFYNQSHITWILAFILPGLIIFGGVIPFMLFIILFINQRKFSQSKFRRYLGYLFNEYNKENYFWEQIKIWMRSIIILLMTYFETNIVVKASLISLTLLFYQLLAINHKPYIINSLNILDVESGQIVSISIFLAVVKYVSEQDESQNVSMLLQIIILLLCGILSYYFISNILRIYIKKYRTLLLSLLHTASSNIKQDSFMTLYFYKQITQNKQKSQLLSQNYEKLRQCLITKSKLQLEQQRQQQPIFRRFFSVQLLQSKHSQHISALETNRLTTVNRTLLLTKEEK